MSQNVLSIFILESESPFIDFFLKNLLNNYEKKPHVHSPHLFLENLKRYKFTIIYMVFFGLSFRDDLKILGMCFQKKKKLRQILKETLLV